MTDSDSADSAHGDKTMKVAEFETFQRESQWSKKEIQVMIVQFAKAMKCIEIRNNYRVHGNEEGCNFFNHSYGHRRPNT